MLDGIAEKQGEAVVFIRHYVRAPDLHEDIASQLEDVEWEPRELVLLDTEQQLTGPQLAQMQNGITVLSKSAWDVSGENRRRGKFVCRFGVLKGKIYPLERIRPHPTDAFPFDDRNVRLAEQKRIPILRAPIVSYADAFKALGKVYHSTHGGYIWLANAIDSTEQLLDHILTLCKIPSLRLCPPPLCPPTKTCC